MWKPCSSRIRQTSRPEKTPNLPMSGFEAGDEHLGVKAAFNFGWVGTFEEELDGFFEVIVEIERVVTARSPFLPAFE